MFNGIYLKGYFFLFNHVTSSKNYRDRISHYRTYRCWGRNWCGFRSFNIRCSKKPSFKRTIIFLCHIGICFFRSDRTIRSDDGFFATLCGLILRTCFFIAFYLRLLISFFLGHSLLCSSIIFNIYIIISRGDFFIHSTLILFFFSLFAL